MSWSGLILLTALPVVAVTVGWLVDQRTQPRRMNHRYGQCPGCRREVVRAHCADGADRVFDAVPLPFADEHVELFPDPGETLFVAADRRMQQVRRARENNAGIWVFNPSPGAVSPRPQHVRSGEGLTLHFCALGLREPRLPAWRGTVSWEIPRG